ncbi:MAG: hypothetical protein CMC78_05475 [Flavobacteriaceae bacterium]|nr:hypothetical protein [Flavobacteriaceae bacterium]
MAKRLSEQEKKEISNLFIEGISSVEVISNKFNCTNATVIRNLKKGLGKEKYQEIIDSRNTNKNSKISNIDKNFENNENNENNEKYSSSLIYQESKLDFVELAPVDYEIENIPRKELSSVPIGEIEFPKIVYMIVNKNIELEIKLLKDYPEWEFLPNEDLKRKTIEIYFDLKTAKRVCSKEQKVIKVPNTDVFRIASPFLISRGISRIVSAEKLISI